jgi:hypothetical protein
MLPPADTMLGVALEVQRRGDVLVPVIVVRGLSVSAALAGAFLVKPSVNFGFDRERRIELSCGISGPDYDCAPDAAAVRGMAAVLPTARTAWVRVALSIPGVTSLPPRDQSLELMDTEAALARLAVLGPSGEALPALPGLDLRGFLDQVARDLGYQNGLADIVPKLVPWVSWLGF